MVWQHGNVMQVNEIGYRGARTQLPTPSADAAAATIPAVAARCSTASSVRRRNPAAIRRVDAIAELAKTR
jgi:hypothetical protein